MRVRRQARLGPALVEFEQLTQRRDAAALARLLEDDRYHSTKLRAGLASALGRTRSSEACEPLATLLENREEHRDIRLMAARGLGTIGDPAGLPALLDALDDGSVPMHVGVAVSLGQIGGRQAVDALLGLLRSQNSTVRAYAAEALGECAGAAAVPALITALEDRSRKVRLDAAKALSKTEDARALEALQVASRREGRLLRGLITEYAEELRERLAREATTDA